MPPVIRIDSGVANSKGRELVRCIVPIVPGIHFMIWFSCVVLTKNGGRVSPLHVVLLPVTCSGPGVPAGSCGYSGGRQLIVELRQKICF